jgi:hypothetical protein
VADDFGPETFAPLQGELEFAASNMLAPDFPVGEAARWYQEFTDGMRAHALLWLLVEGDAQSCFRDLTVSAQVRRHFLRRCQKEGVVDLHCACSRVEPFLDAVAAQSRDVARDIARLSPAAWMTENEYEDDFSYARFLHLWVANAPPERPVAELVALLDQMEKALEGAASARLDVCRALLARDQEAFRDAFDLLLDERKEEVEKRAVMAVNEPVATLDCTVFVEGLALLRLADELGFAIEAEYPGCPRLARARSQVGSVPDTLPAP